MGKEDKDKALIIKIVENQSNGNKDREKTRY